MDYGIFSICLSWNKIYMTTDKIKVLVVDDSSFMRSVLARLIEKDERFEVVGKATNGQEGVDMAKQLKPDIVTMDIEMPVMNGLEALEKIMSTDPRRVVMVSSLTEEGAAATVEALEKGAVDFIPKALQDKDRNIFQAAGALHDKLAAAAGSHVQRRRSGQPELNKPSPQGERFGSAAALPSLARQVEVDKTALSARRKEKCPSAKLLLIGSSTGGPRALQDVIPHLPANLRVPVVIAQHMPANFTKAMASRMNVTSPLEVVEAQHGDVLKAGTVYLAPGGMLTRVKKEGVNLVVDVCEDPEKSYIYHPSVDALTESVNQSLGGDVLAVMLTGMGADGSKEFAKLQQKGAYVIAEDESSCVVFGMPKSVIAENAACEVLPLADIAPTLKRLLA